VLHVVDIPEPPASVPAAGSRRALGGTGTLKYFYGPMDCGKSTLALHLDHSSDKSRFPVRDRDNFRWAMSATTRKARWLGTE